jgi:hypothetical protein
MATGEIVHVDASLMRANVSWESLIERHVVEVLDGNNVEVEKQDRQSGKSKKVCVTDERLIRAHATAVGQLHERPNI